MENFAQNIRQAIKHWWIHVLIGVLMVALSIWVFMQPLGTYIALSIFFVVSFLVNGLMGIIFSVSNRHSLPGWGWHLGISILELSLGVLLALQPAISMAILPFYVSFWLLTRGVLLIAFSFDLRSQGSLDWGWLLAGGILATLLAFSILFNPLVGVIGIVAWTGAAIMISGIFSIVLGFQLRKAKVKLIPVS